MGLEVWLEEAACMRQAQSAAQVDGQPWEVCAVVLASLRFTHPYPSIRQLWDSNNRPGIGQGNQTRSK